MAAVALAERVAAERGEACKLGDGDVLAGVLALSLEDAPRPQVGYSVRLDARGGPHTRLEFCTVGVLLRRLAAGDCAATHVVVDEAHERDALTDFLLVVLKTRTLRGANAPKVASPAFFAGLPPSPRGPR